MVQSQTPDVFVNILLGTGGVLLFIVFSALTVLLFQRNLLKEKQIRVLQEIDFQNKMIKLQLESQERERKRIGADLHDSLGSLLWGAKVNASYIKRTVGMDEEGVASYNELTQILDESISTVRRISWELTPDAFHYSGLSASVTKLCQRLSGKGIDIQVTEDGHLLWDDDRALQVFRIIQELISNVMKHSGATKLMVHLEWQIPKQLEVKVVDNGVGLPANAEKNGVGFWNVDQRVKQLKGKINMGIPPMHSGLQVSLEIPLSHD